MTAYTKKAFFSPIASLPARTKPHLSTPSLFRYKLSDKELLEEKEESASYPGVPTVYRKHIMECYLDFRSNPGGNSAAIDEGSLKKLMSLFGIVQPSVLSTVVAHQKAAAAAAAGGNGSTGAGHEDKLPKKKDSVMVKDIQKLTFETQVRLEDDVEVIF